MDGLHEDMGNANGREKYAHGDWLNYLTGIHRYIHVHKESIALNSLLHDYDDFPEIALLLPQNPISLTCTCLLYTSDAADE